MKRKKNPQKRSYAEVMEDLQKAVSPKEYRAIHKELKRDHKSRLFLFQRYPNAPIYASAVAVVFIVITLIVQLLQLL